MTTPAQAPSRRAEMIVEEIVRRLVLFGYAGVGPRTGGSVELGGPYFERESRAHQAAWGVAHFAVSLLGQDKETISSVVDSLQTLGWPATLRSTDLSFPRQPSAFYINVRSP